MEEGLLVKGDAERKRKGKLYKHEVERQGYIAAPMLAVTLSLYLIPLSSSMMVGHLGELALSSTAIATSLTAVTGISLLQGMAGGLDTLCGQAYGAHHYKKLGVHTYSAIISLLLACVPISLLWFSLGNILSFTGQDPVISLKAGKYAVWMIPSLLATAVSQPMMRFLQAQSLIFPMLLSSAITLCFHVPLCWILVFKSGLHNVGAALSIGISYWLNVFILGLYIKCSKSCRATYAPFSREAFRGIPAFLKLGIPSAVMTCLQWWSYEMIILLSGLLPNPRLETSVLSICLANIQGLYAAPFALGAAASTRVSNELGAGNSEGARMVVHVVVFLAATEAVLVGVTLFALRRVIGYVYSDEKEVIDNVMEMIPLVSISVIIDSLQGVLSGVARGSGWQHIGAYVNLGALYLFGIPLSVVLGFLLHIRGKGLWIGIQAGSALQMILLIVVTGCTNWQKQTNLARERIFEDRLPLGNGLK